MPSSKKAAGLTSWHHENILLICTYNYEYFTFARFEGEHYSNAKITTFSWSPDEPIRTLCEHNLPALKWPKDDGEDKNKWLKDWATAFDVEKVTKKFFQEYKELYELLYKDLSNNHIFRNQAVKYNLDVSNFAKKLLGQIVFIYFIQKKGWLGVPKDDNWGSGDKRFLRNLFNECIDQNDNFFNNYLEPLFYDALNNPRRNEVDPSYHPKFKCKIPFLNGGLFEPEYDWSTSNIYIDNNIFEQILNTFDGYNFTVKEDTPLDVEVAVDPEMLGKVFENLLEENLRKGKGTYYTPREIVHYMCQESLINYLSSESGITDEEIRNLILSAYVTYSQEEISQTVLNNADKLDDLLVGIKVVDPACGSGAFLVGMLHEIVNLRLMLQKILSTNSSVSEYQIKKDTIQNCIYGVDIDPGAIEIAKLRLWLSLVVDYELTEIEPLPNLDYKIMQGNSLLEELVLGEKSIKLFDPSKIGMDDKMKNLFDKEEQFSLLDQDSFIKEIFDKYHEWQEKLFNAKSLEAKKKIREEIKQIENDLIEKTITDEIERLESVNEHIGRRYLGTGIGLSKNDTNKRQEIFELQNNIKNILKEVKATGHRPYFLWHLYFGDVFLNKGGFDIIIANPPYVRADSGNEHLALRNAIKETKQYETLWEKWDIYIPFIEKGYKILKPFGVMTMIVSDAYCHSKYAQKSQSWFLKNSHIIRLDFFSKIKIFDAAVRNITFFFQKADGSNYKMERRVHDPKFGKVTFLPTDEQKKLDYRVFFPGDANIQLFLKPTVPLSEICYITKGMVVHANERVAQGAFELGDLLSIVKDHLHLKPFAEGKDINKWLSHSHKWLEWGTERAPMLFSRPTFIELYEQEEKLLLAKIGEIRAVFDEQRLYCNEGVYICIPWYRLKGVLNNSLKKTARYSSEKPLRDLPKREEFENNSQRFSIKFLLGVINSAPARKFLSANRRSNVQLYPDDWKKLPIPDIMPEQQRHIIKLVDWILAAKFAEPSTDVSEYERQIDQLVYKLYDLTPEEIAIVEGK